MTNPVLKEILFLEEEKVKADFTVETKAYDVEVHFPDVKAVSMSEDRKLLKVDCVDSAHGKEKIISRYFNMNEVIDFFFEFCKKEDKDNVN